MAELTEEQKKQIAEALIAAATIMKADNTVPVTVIGGGHVTTDNPRFKIEHGSA